MVSEINWEDYLPKDATIVTEAVSVKSGLSHAPSIQSITKKAIVTRITKNTSSSYYYEDHRQEVHVQVFLLDNTTYIGLDITGIPLHRRGYRTEAGDAPIKENLAAALITLSDWKYRLPLWDPFCGSGTIAIEAALLARNIAPGLGRSFAVERFPFFNLSLYRQAQKHLKAQIYPSGTYTIIASDHDASVVEKAERNAKRAQVDMDITFSVQTFRDNTYKETLALFGDARPITMISNPPYGERLVPEEMEVLYQDILSTLNSPDILGGIITSSEIWENMVPKKHFRDRKLYNGNLPARFWLKKSER